MLYVNPQTAHSFQQGDMKPGAKARDAEVLREYEQLFIYQMLKEMRKTVPDYGVVDGPQQDHFHEMMDDFLAGEMARSGQFGIAAQLEAQIALQEAGVASTSTYSEGISLYKTAPAISLTQGAPGGIPLKTAPGGYLLTRPEQGIPLVKEKGAAPPANAKALAHYEQHLGPVTPVTAQD